jgi:hypothetical protein
MLPKDYSEVYRTLRNYCYLVNAELSILKTFMPELRSRELANEVGTHPIAPYPYVLPIPQIIKSYTELGNHIYQVGIPDSCAGRLSYAHQFWDRSRELRTKLEDFEQHLVYEVDRWKGMAIGGRDTAAESKRLAEICEDVGRLLDTVKDEGPLDDTFDEGPE